MHYTGLQLAYYLMLAMKQGYHCWAEYRNHRYDYYCNVGRG